MKDDNKTKKQLVHELTELRSQNAELKKSESSEKYRSLVENIRDVIYELDSQGLVLYISPAIRDMLGYDSAEIIGKNFIDLAYKDDQSSLAEWFSELRKGVESPSEYRISNKSSELRWARTKTRPIMEDGLFKGAHGILIDVTPQKRAEEALRKSEELLRSYLENAPDGIYISDLEGNFIYGNRKCEEILGYRREELIGKNFLELNLLPENSLNKAIKLLQANMEGKPTGPDEIDLISKEGHLIPVEINTNVIQCMGQRVVLASVRDITKRKRAEEMLLESEEKYRELVKYAPAGIYEIDYETGRFTSVNDVMCEYSGYTKDELLNTNLYSLMTYESQKLMDERLWKLFAGEIMPQPVEYCIRTKGGEKLWTLLNARYIYEDGKLKGATGIIYNISERKRAEEEMRRMNIFLDSIVENIPNMLFLKDAKDLRFVRFNRAGEDLLGYSRDDLLGKSDYDFFSKEQADFFTEKDREVLRGKEVVDIPEESVHTHNKGERTLHTKKVPILGADGEPEYLLGISEDITERNLADEQLKHTLESLRKALGTIIQVMVSAVDVRDPYTAGHQVRSADIARAIATEMGLSQEKIEGIRMAGSIHDIGKLSIPAEILSKPARLSAIEFSLVKEHARTGYEMLKNVESPWPLAQIVYQHHERMDGSGYPRKLKGDEIIMEARIMAVADVVEAMASHRPYRPGLGIDAALNEIEKNRGIFYDDTVADACLRLFREKGFKIEGA
jgi:PAS domain S-box-containing protein